MKRLTWLAVLAFLLVLPPAHAYAGYPASRTQVLLGQASSYADLRARLYAYVDSLGATDRLGAGEAEYFLGVSYDRGGEGDSAIACYRRALEHRGARDELLALADVLLMRHRPGDLATVDSLLAPALASFGDDTPGVRAALEGRLAWSAYLADRVDSAAARFASAEAELSTHPLWRFRMACVNLTRGDVHRAVRLLMPLAVASRRQDAEVMRMLRDGLAHLTQKGRLDDAIEYDLAARDRGEDVVIQHLGGRRVRIKAVDGFPLEAVVIPPAHERPRVRARAAVVLMAPGDTVAVYDSLAVELSRHGLTVALLELRGSGHSVAPGCALPYAWRGAEELLQLLSAKDASAVRRALAGTDTSRALVVGVGPTTVIAIEAARLDPHFHALLLVSPAPAPTDRGIARAGLEALQLPTYIQIAPEDFGTSYELSDLLYHACDMKASRVADSGAQGRGAALFRSGARIAARFTTWLDEQLPESSKLAPPPRPRR